MSVVCCNMFCIIILWSIFSNKFIDEVKYLLRKSDPKSFFPPKSVMTYWFPSNLQAGTNKW